MNAAISRPSAIPLFVAQAVGLSAVIAVSAHVSVPFWPVPMTLQTLAVMGIATLCGARLGVAAMLAVLVEGAFGLPVFASGGGVATLVGPTAGYLIGMLFAAGIVGRARSGWGRAGAIVGSTLLIYGLGAAWLAGFVGPSKAVELGVVPFLIDDAAKGAMVWALGGLRRTA